MIRDWRAQDYRLGNGDVRGSKEEVKNGLRLGRETSRQIYGLGQRVGMDKGLKSFRVWFGQITHVNVEVTTSNNILFGSHH